MPDEINLDTNAAIAFVAEGSSIRHHLKATVAGKAMLMTATAEREFTRIVMASAGPVEQARAVRLLARLRVIPSKALEHVSQYSGQSRS